MRQFVLFSALIVALGVGARASASDSVGIYALVDRVTVNESVGTPTIVIRGKFALANVESGQYFAGTKGYLHYTVARLSEQKRALALNEWNDLKKLAQTPGTCVAFASRRSSEYPAGVPLGVVRGAQQAVANPDAYPIEGHTGVVALKPSHPMCEELRQP